MLGRRLPSPGRGHRWALWIPMGRFQDPDRRCTMGSRRSNIASEGFGAYVARAITVRLAYAATCAGCGGGSRRACRARLPGDRRHERPRSGRRAEAAAGIGAGEPADALLHERSAEVVDAPVERLSGRIEPHLHPAGLEITDAATERQTNTAVCLRFSSREISSIP